MDGIESAIRNALARGDVRDRTFRERVYRSVFAALERKLAENPELGPDEAQHRREVLKQRIVGIEKEFVPRPVPAAAAAPAPVRPPEVHPEVREEAHPPAVEPQHRHAGAPPGAAPVVEAERSMRQVRPGPARIEPSVEPLSVHPDRESPMGEFSLPGIAGDLRDDAADDPEERRRRPWVLLMIGAVVAAILAIGLWWAVTTGMFGRDDGSVPNPPVELEEDEFEPGTPPPLSQDGSSEPSWVTIFSAADTTGVAPLGGARVETLTEEDKPFLRATSPNAEAAIRFSVPADALAKVAGGKAIFDLVARAQEGEEPQISVSCDFGALGGCGRHRYVVGLHKSDYLFEVDIPAGAPPAGGGSISLITDVEGGGKAVDLFEIRLAPAQ